MPNICNTLRDDANNMTYQVMAYRTLSREEVLLSVRHFLSQPRVRRREKPLQNQTIKILTIYGASPRL